MSEFRQDIVTKSWSLIVKGRKDRPNDFEGNGSATPKNLPEVSNICVFCPKRIQEQTNIILQYPKGKDWQVKVIPNKYPSLTHDLSRSDEQFYAHRPGSGDHEVVVVRPHNQPTGLQSVELVDLTLQAYIERVNELKKHEEVRYVHIIQNHGLEAGASLVHPHSQIFATPFLPARLEDELKGTREYYSVTSNCLYCEIVKHELWVKERIVINSDNFIVMTPYASRRAYHLRIVPKWHEAAFEQISADKRKELAEVLKETLKRLYDRMDNPSFNYYFHSLPDLKTNKIKSHNDEKSYHWHLIILPRTAKWAGFELGTDVAVNPVPPEEAAQFLRD